MCSIKARKPRDTLWIIGLHYIIGSINSETMRSRPNSNRTTPTPAAPSAQPTSDDGDCNGKDKAPVRFKRPPMAAFKLPPPPQMNSIIPQRKPNPIRTQSTPTPPPAAAETAGSAAAVSAPTPQAQGEEVHEITLPDFSTSNESAAYKRGRHKIKPPTSSVSSPAESSRVAPTYQACPPVVNGSRVSYTNDIDYRTQSYTATYKPSNWYAETQKRKQRMQYLWKLNTAVLAIILAVSLVGAFVYLRSHPELGTTEKRHRRRTNHHHHHHGDFHPMLGVNEMTLEFGIAESHRHQSRPIDETERVHDLFSVVKVKRLSNEKLIPYVGFALASHSVDHKQIPIVVSTLLSYASSDTEGGGGIALIDCVVDEDLSKLDKGTSFYSISPEKAVKYELEEEKLESVQAETAVTLVGRAITFFGKEHITSRDGKASSNAASVYDYENRLEVHVAVGLSGPELGEDETIKALKAMWGSLDGLVAPFPNDLESDAGQWANWKHTVDYRIDVRLHVLVRPNCHSQQNGHLVPCTSDEGNADNLERFMQSYRVLERLYEGGLIASLGLDGAHESDVKHLLSNCKTKPQLYRGDVASALHYAPHLAKHEEFDNSLAKLLQSEDITYMASNVAGHVLSKISICPNAYHLLQNLGGVLYRAHLLQLTKDGTTLSQTRQEYYSVARVILSFLVSQKVVVSPHAFKAEHLADDAPESVSSLSTFLILNQRRLAEIGVAFEALLKSEDLPEEHGLGNEDEKVAAVFHNLSHGDVFLSKNGVALDEQGGTVKAHSTTVIACDSGDKFSVRGGAGEEVMQVSIEAKAGDATDFTIE